MESNDSICVLLGIILAEHYYFVENYNSLVYFVFMPQLLSNIILFIHDNLSHMLCHMHYASRYMSHAIV